MELSVPYDLLITGGHVYDPAQGLDRVMDIGVRAGYIESIGPGLVPEGCERIVQLKSNQYVVPGLIDVHTHFMVGAASPGLGWQALAPDIAGVSSGVTTLLDAGTTGVWNFGIYPYYIRGKAKTRLMALLNIGRMGVLGQPFLIPDLNHPDEIDIDATIKVCDQNREAIKGIKLRLVGPVIDSHGETIISKTKETASEVNLPVMVHIGDLITKNRNRAPALTRHLLKNLDPGDILTHVCTAHPGGVLDANNHLVPELREAQERGVYFDPASGRNNFNYEVCQRLADQQFHPHTISTDISVPGRTKIVFSLVESMSKFLALGYSFEQVIRMTTTNAALVLGMQKEIGALCPGRIADISVLELVTGSWAFEDAWGSNFYGDMAIVPVQTVRGGDLISPDWGPHPWGWLPKQDPSKS